MEEPDCEVIHINLPVRLEANSAISMMVMAEGEVLIRAALMELPVSITWLDSDGRSFDHRIVTSKIEPLCAQREGLFDPSRFETATVKSMTGAPMYVILEDSAGRKSKLRLEFRPYKN